MEEAFTFQSGENTLVGILHQPDTTMMSKAGVVIVVGGPQTRVGSHRQFVLLARHLCSNGIPVLRFDYHGMGDSDGTLSSFEDCEKDIKSAVDTFFEKVPDRKSVVLWGLCDAAAASTFYAYQDARVKGLVLLNPWVRTASGEAKAYVKHYYLSRLMDKELWQKILSGKFNPFASLGSLFQNMTVMLSDKKGANKKNEGSLFDESVPLPTRLYQGLSRFTGKVLLILSGDDLTAAEFVDLVNGSKEWNELINSGKFTEHTLPEANHTFSKQVWRDEVAKYTQEWLSKF